MTTYHVWLTGQDEPERVEADDVREIDGGLAFYGLKAAVTLVRGFQPDEWQRWSTVDDASAHI